MLATEKDLRFHTKELLDRVKRGEEVIITYRGKPCAKLIPLENENFDNPLFGIWHDHTVTKNVGQYVRNLREGKTK